jgi:hypothetical protein
VIPVSIECGTAAGVVQGSGHSLHTRMGRAHGSKRGCSHSTCLSPALYAGQVQCT